MSAVLPPADLPWAGPVPAPAAVVPVNPWRPVGPCTPEECVQDSAAAVGRVVRGARILAAVVIVLAGVPAALLSRTFASRRRQAAFTRMWARVLLRALGLRLEVVGPPDAALGDAALGDAAAPGGAAPAVGSLVVANHVSWLDPLVVAATLPARPLAKQEIAAWPVVRTLVSGAGALFIDRERLMELPSTVAAVAQALRAGDSVVAFPEGTTWCGRGMGEFRPAVFQAAVDAAAAVRPITLRYLEGAEPSTRACFVGEDTLLASVLRVTATRDLVVEVTLRAPLDHAVRDAPAPPGPWARAELAKMAESRVRQGVPGHHRLPSRGVGV
ncbi:lysophospholipid acyltransferase family protein [Nonomuraea antimicrobica]|uniref:Lysophospholipid acyltransferase family protein n=1 Tax=Nonomuraea antimicrobica TaxID=561173 RepID=A0ABP7E6R6_9ACTN